MKVDTIINQSLRDFNKLSDRELTKQINYLNKYANQRIDRLKKNKITNRATKKLDQMGIDKFKLKRGATEEEKKQLFMKLKNFLTEKTSTVSGHFEYQTNVRQGLQKRGIEISTKNQDKFFSIFDKLSEEVELNQDMKYAVMNEISNHIDSGWSDETLIKVVKSRLSDIYKERQKYRIQDIFYGDFSEDERANKRITYNDAFKKQRKKRLYKNKHRKK